MLVDVIIEWDIEMERVIDGGGFSMGAGATGRYPTHPFTLILILTHTLSHSYSYLHTPSHIPFLPSLPFYTYTPYHTLSPPTHPPHFPSHPPLIPPHFPSLSLPPPPPLSDHKSMGSSFGSRRVGVGSSRVTAAQLLEEALNAGKK